MNFSLEYNIKDSTSRSMDAFNRLPNSNYYIGIITHITTKNKTAFLIDNRQCDYGLS